MESDRSPAFAEYFAALHRRRGLLLRVAGPIALLGVVVALGLPSEYRSQGMFELEEAKLASYLPTSREGSRPVNQLDQYVGSLSEAVLTNARLAEVVKSVNPYPDLQADLGAAIEAVRDNTDVKMVKRRILDPMSGREREVISGFTVGFDDRDPVVAGQVAKWLTEQYAQANRENFRRRAEGAASFLQAEGERFRGRIAAAEQKLSEFKSRNAGRLPDQSDLNLNLMDRTDRELENTTAQIRSLQSQRIFLVQELERARANPGADSVRELEVELARRLTLYDENHPDVVSLRQQLEIARQGGAAGPDSLQAQLEAQRTVLNSTRQRYSDDHPDVRRVQRNIEQLEARIAAGGGGAGSVAQRRTPVIMQLQTQINAIDSQIASLQGQSFGLRAKLNEFEQRVTTTPEVEREYQLLTRDLNTLREKYNELQNRQMDAELNAAAIAGGAGDEFRLVQAPGTPSTPAFPPRAAIAILGLIIGLVLGLTAAILAEAMDPNVRGTHDVRRIFRSAPLAVVPEIETAEVASLARTRLLTYFGVAAAAAVVLFLALRLAA